MVVTKIDIFKKKKKKQGNWRYHWFLPWTDVLVAAITEQKVYSVSNDIYWVNNDDYHSSSG